ncbi:MAG: hypothetical protein WAL63_16010 [Solirubrobacteraceae bacterium]
MAAGRQIAALLVVVAIGGCGGASSSETAARAVALQWLEASVNGNGRTYCALLAPAMLRRAQSDARLLGPRVTCAQAESTHPPHTSHLERVVIARQRRQAAKALRIDSARVHGDRATVDFSWDAPSSPGSRTASGRATATRLHQSVSLVRVDGQWKVG